MVVLSGVRLRPKEPETRKNRKTVLSSTKDTYKEFTPAHAADDVTSHMRKSISRLVLRVRYGNVMVIVLLKHLKFLQNNV
jgi:hypothetical protein